MKEIMILRKMGACVEAVGDGDKIRGWLEDQPDFETAWKVCPHGDRMLWLLRKVLDSKDENALRRLTLAKARCAKRILHLMKDERSRRAVEVAEHFGLGDVTRRELDEAAAAAAAAAAEATSPAAVAAAGSAYAASSPDVGAKATSYVVAAATVAAISAANAAYVACFNDCDYAATAYREAYDDAYASAEKRMQAQCADAIREIYKEAPIL